MATTLLTTGLLCLIAAIVGGGIEALGGKIPVIQSSKRQTALGLFGIILLLGAWFSSSSSVSPGVVPKDRSSSDPERLQSGSSLLDFEGTTWEGALTFKTNGVKTPLQIVFGHDGSALVSRGPIGFSLTDHCTVAGPSNGTITLDCPYLTTGDAYHTTTFHQAHVYVVSINGASISGSMHEPGDPNKNSSVSLLKRE